MAALRIEHSIFLLQDALTDVSASLCQADDDLLGVHPSYVHRVSWIINSLHTSQISIFDACIA